VYIFAQIFTADRLSLWHVLQT